MAWFEKSRERAAIPQTKELWTVCPRCKTYVAKGEWTGVCPSCGYHGRMKARARIADLGRQNRLDGHVDILVVDVERELPRLDARFDGCKARIDRGEILIRDDALRRKHARMGARTRDILMVERLVHGKRCPELLREFAHVLLETT